MRETKEAKPRAEGVRTAVDQAQRVAFHLQGKRLRVELLPGFRLDIEDAAELGLAVWAFYCQPRDFSKPSAHATLPFDPAAKDFKVELSHDVARDVGYCYFEAAGVAPEAVGWFLPEEEVFPGEVVTADPEENERRARAATDCAKFIAQASIEIAWPGPGQILAPGVAPTVDVRAYWLGPEVGERRATVGHAIVESDWDDRDRPVALPHYAAYYQTPEDGCLSDLIPQPEGADLGFHPGRELYITSTPAASPLVRSYLRDPDALGGSDRYRARLRSGERVTVLSGSPFGFAVLTPTTLVELEANGGRVPEPARLLELLRPLEE